MTKTMISVAELSQAISQGSVKIIDASWYLPNFKRNCYEDYCQHHIDGAVFIDIEQFCDHSDPYPHALPSAQDFADMMSQKSILPEDMIVCYDTAGLFSAARIWAICKHYGHDNVFILDGGLPAWQHAGNATIAGEDIASTPTLYPVPQNHHGFIINLQGMEQAVNDGASLIDARDATRFSGQDAEPRPNLPSGHIPGAHNICFKQCLDNGHMKSPEDLKQILSPLLAKDHHVTYCGSGVTACVLVAAAYHAGYDGDLQIYDGAWTEWGSVHGDTAYGNAIIAKD